MQIFCFGEKKTVVFGWLCVFRATTCLRMLMKRQKVSQKVDQNQMQTQNRRQQLKIEKIAKKKLKRWQRWVATFGVYRNRMQLKRVSFHESNQGDRTTPAAQHVRRRVSEANRTDTRARLFLLCVGRLDARPECHMPGLHQFLPPEWHFHFQRQIRWLCVRRW